MTLVLTELSPHGIAMAADSALTVPVSVRQPWPVRFFTGIRKLMPVPYLHAGVSVRGLAQIEEMYVDAWLTWFIDEARSRVQTLREFATLLQDTLQQRLGPLPPQETVGFHLAGYEGGGAARDASFYNVHNGPSQYYARVDPAVVNANHDVPPARYRQLAAAGQLPYITRNGDYQYYVWLFERIERWLDEAFRQKGTPFPREQSLNARAEYLRFQIRTVASIYGLLGQPSIGGEITTLTISPFGIQSYETRA